MGLRINQNIAAANAYRNLSITDGQMGKSLEKLSSGFRINRAADDAAGLSISEGLRSQIGGLKVAVRNSQDGINVVQSADGALNETTAILQRMRDLAVQASNSGSQDSGARTAAQTELSQLNSELDRIGNTTSFGASKLLNGTFGLQAAKITGTSQVTGTTATTTAAADTFTLTLNAASGATGAGAAQTVTLANVGAGTFTDDAAGAAALQTALQADIDAATNLNGYVKATVQFDTLTSKNQITLSRADAKSSADNLTLADGTGTPLSKLGLVAGAGAATGTSATFQVGANNTAADRIQVSIAKVDSTSLNTGSINLVTNATAAIDTLDSALKSVSTTRSNLGAYQNRFERTINNLNVAVENLSASESQIRDTDMAQEMTAFTRAQILQQAGTSMLAQANSSQQSVLKLLG